MRQPYWCPDDVDDLPNDKSVETPQSDALIVPMLRAVERELAKLERAPTRRRQSFKRQQERARAIDALVRRFKWLMLRYQEIENRPPPQPSYEERARSLQALENRIAELAAEYCGHPR